MGFVHPKDLKIGDIIKFVRKKSWINRECDVLDGHPPINIGDIYEVYKIEKADTDGHICGDKNMPNPLLRLQSNRRRNRLTAWWGCWICLNREINIYGKPKIFGIVKWMKENVKV